MTLPSTADHQLILLPARTAQEASVWGSAVTDYAAAFGPIQFARDPERVDWREYQHVTLVRPSYWPDDLPLIIKQANPEVVIDRIPVDTPEALQVILAVRVYYGWRYGPQTEFDWAQVWPQGKSLIGLHGRADGELQDADFAVIQTARLEAVKVTSHATPANLQRLRQINPDMFVLVRLYMQFSVDGAPRRLSPDEFVYDAVYTFTPLYQADARVRYVEVHNEPNLTLEGLGGSWSNGAEFGEWFRAVVARLRVRFPDVKFGFPGLSPGPEGAAFGGRREQLRFLRGAADAIQASADWVGLHSYWVNEKEMFDHDLGFNFITYRQLFPEKLLFITEFGNPQQSKDVVAAQYARYFGMLRNVKGLGGAFAYVSSTSDVSESVRWAWRDEAGRDVGIAPVVGRRQFIRN